MIPKLIRWLLLTITPWLIVATVEKTSRELHGEHPDIATQKALRTFRFGWILTGVVMLGVWLVKRG